MADPTNNPQTPATAKPETGNNSAKPAQTVAGDSTEGAEKANKLSKEEQMAAFEEDLKYNDWGHQPC